MNLNQYGSSQKAGAEDLQIVVYMDTQTAKPLADLVTPMDLLHHCRQPFFDFFQRRDQLGVLLRYSR
jgi:hypothetical protein